MVDEMIETLKGEIKRVYGDGGATVTNIVSYAIKEGIIHPTGIRDFNIKRQFANMQATTDLSKTKIMYTLSDQHGLSESTIYFILNPDKK